MYLSSNEVKVVENKGEQVLPETIHEEVIKPDTVTHNGETVEDDPWK